LGACVASWQAVAAKHHGVPFFIAAPSTSFDLTLASGKQIVIEERPAQELTHVQGQQVGLAGWLSCSSSRTVHDMACNAAAAASAGGP
jgi:methylthioribose-1-phosphate isomerase